MQPIAATGFALTLMGILFLLGHSVVQIAFGLPPPGLGLALLGGLAAFVTTALGALPAIILRKLPQRMEDVMLGLAAGMMLAATAFSLIVPALNASGALVSHKGLASGVVVFGMSLGVLLMLGLGLLAPAMNGYHEFGCLCLPLPYTTCQKVWQLVPVLRKPICAWACR